MVNARNPLKIDYLLICFNHSLKTGLLILYDLPVLYIKSLFISAFKIVLIEELAGRLKLALVFSEKSSVLSSDMANSDKTLL